MSLLRARPADAGASRSAAPLHAPAWGRPAARMPCFHTSTWLKTGPCDECSTLFRVWRGGRAGRGRDTGTGGTSVAGRDAPLLPTIAAPTEKDSRCETLNQHLLRMRRALGAMCVQSGRGAPGDHRGCGSLTVPSPQGPLIPTPTETQKPSVPESADTLLVFKSRFSSGQGKPRLPSV